VETECSVVLASAAGSPVETECSVVLDSAAGSPVEDLKSDLSDLIDFLWVLGQRHDITLSILIFSACVVHILWAAAG
jgi:ABC-type glucose/galactose transport system permease subunit